MSARWLMALSVLVALSVGFKADAWVPTVSGGSQKSGAWYYTITPPNGQPKILIGPYTTLSICRDWLGSCLYEHGPNCLDDPTDANCAGVGPGFGGSACSPDCFMLGERWGYYYIDYTDWSLVGPFSLRQCKERSDECFAVGDISNSEGSKGGP
jgi:hypothetical protein